MEGGKDGGGLLGLALEGIYMANLRGLAGLLVCGIQILSASKSCLTQ